MNCEVNMTEDEVKVIRSLRDRGFACVIFTPEELRNAPNYKIEDSMVDSGWEAIDYWNTGEED